MYRQSLVIQFVSCAMLRGSRGCRTWEVRVSTMARNTHNPIRQFVENLNLKPNPNLKLIPLSVGDPTLFGNLKPPEEVLDAVYDIVKLNESRNYGPLVGHLEARKAVAEYSSHQGPVSPDDVILCSGCSHAVELVITVLAEAGKNILAPRPGYMIYKTLAKGLGIEIKFYNLLPDQNWEVDLVSLESLIDDDTVAIVVNNPSNPCGSVYRKEHLQDILEIAEKNCLPIIADEIYEHIVFSDNKYTAISALSKNVPVLTCSGLTKRFLVPGWRMGWVIIHDRHNILGKDVRDGFSNMSGRILGTNTLIQKALPKILKSTPQSFFSEMMSFIESQARLACKELQKAPGLRPIMPQGSMYMIIEVKMSFFPKFDNEIELIKRLCYEQSVLCIPGQCFNYPGFMRIVLTVPEEVLQDACDRIVTFCNEHAVNP